MTDVPSVYRAQLAGVDTWTRAELEQAARDFAFAADLHLAERNGERKLRFNLVELAQALDQQARAILKGVGAAVACLNSSHTLPYWGQVDAREEYHRLARELLNEQVATGCCDLDLGDLVTSNTVGSP